VASFNLAPCRDFVGLNVVFGAKNVRVLCSTSNNEDFWNSLSLGQGRLLSERHLPLGRNAEEDEAAPRLAKPYSGSSEKPAQSYSGGNTSSKRPCLQAHYQCLIKQKFRAGFASKLSQCCRQAAAVYVYLLTTSRRRVG
jgi:hypothetical protein